MRRLTPAESVDALAWIQPSKRDDPVGMDLSGWKDSVWVLHSMYENSSLPSHISYDQARRAAIESGIEKPVIINGFSLDDGGAVTIGVGLGFRDRPGEGWRRLTWHEYFARLGQTPGHDEAFPPSFRWFSGGGWPVSVDFPAEGSLDGESLRALVSLLTNRAPAAHCFFYSAALTTGDFDNVEIHEGRVSDIFELVGERAGQFSPSNFWPADHSWFVYTDYDLCATRVSGPAALIAALEADPILETLRWDPPPDGSNA